MLDKIISKNGIMEKALDATWLRNEAISNNIANADTPGYKRQTVNFEDTLASTMNDFELGSAKKDAKFLPIGNDVRSIPAPEVGTDKFTSMRQDKNNVDIDVEMADLAKNTIKYNALVAQLNKQFSIIKYSITGGR